MPLSRFCTHLSPLLIGAEVIDESFHSRIDPRIQFRKEEYEMLPRSLAVEIRDESPLEIIQYMLDGQTTPLYRTKLMVVGYEQVGKTSLLECLFSYITSGPVLYNDEQVKLEVIKKDFVIRPTTSTPPTTLHLGDGKWSVYSPPESPTTIELRSDDTLASSARSLLFTINEEKERSEVVKRLRRICGDERTHGIDIQKHRISLQSLPSRSLSSDSLSTSLSSSSSTLDLKGVDLELSVWDFAGQHSYYNSHHYFLSARSVFLVVWNVLQGEKGILDLEFWLRSLRAHLPPPPTGKSKPLYSIIIVGTHIDEVGDRNANSRREKAKEVFEKKGVMSGFPFQYLEVSSKTGENFDTLLNTITTSAYGHSYMGERIPDSYLQVEGEIMKLREEKRALPIVALDDTFFRRFGSLREERVRRAIKLLHQWGECVHFSESELLSSHLIVDPTFLSQRILGNLFHPDTADKIPNGELKHSDLKEIWPAECHKNAEYLLALMEKFEVCFRMGQNEDDFWARRSIVTGYLPEEPMSPIQWPDRCPPKMSQIRWTYTFNIIPKELVSRLLVRLHEKLEVKERWKTGIFLESPNGEVKIHVNAQLMKNSLRCIVRGAEMTLARCIISLIGREIGAVCKYYPGVTSKLEDDTKDSEVPKKWWNLSPPENKSVAGGSDDFPEIKIFPSVGSDGNGLVGKLQLALESCGGSLDDVDEAFSLYNWNSLQAFELHRAQLAARYVTAPSWFKSDHWKRMGDLERRTKFLEKHQEHVDKFEWNTTEHLKVSLMVHGTSLASAQSIAKSGFGVVGRSGDPGWYGKGIYTTSTLRYAHNYAKSDHLALIICAVLPGNVFPVVDGTTYSGGGVENGYQSHYTAGMVSSIFHLTLIGFPSPLTERSLF